MTLLELMCAICLFAPIGTAIGSLRQAQRSWLAYFFAAVIGGGVGFLFAWAMRSLAVYYGSRLNERPEAERWYVNALFLVGMYVWVFVAAGVGGWLPQALLRYL